MNLGRRSAGFTLVEVLVALVVVAVTLGAGVRAAGALTGNAERLAGITAAQWCADNRLTGLKLARGQGQGSFPDIGDTEFSCEQLGRIYKGRQVVRPTPNPNFRRVDARLFDESGQPLLVLSTIVGRS
jgi:general secretion pathway protein I